MRGEEEEEMEEEEEEEGGISGAGGWWQGEVKVVVGVLVVLLVVVCFGEPDCSHFSVFRPKRSFGVFEWGVSPASVLLQFVDKRNTQRTPFCFLRASFALNVVLVYFSTLASFLLSCLFVCLCCASDRTVACSFSGGP